MPAYQVKVTLEHGGVMLLGFIAQNPRKLNMQHARLSDLLSALPVSDVEVTQLPGKRKRKKG